MLSLTKLTHAIKQTFSNRSNATVLGSIGIGTALSSSFAFGVITSPLSMAATYGMAQFSQTTRGRHLFSEIFTKIPLGTQKVAAQAEKITAFLLRIREDYTMTTCLSLPIVEELIFRGAVQTGSVALVGPVAGVALSSLVFAAAHADPDRPHQVVNALMGGIIFGTLTQKVSIAAAIGHHIGSNSFWGPILGHSPDRGIVHHYLYG